MTFPLPPECCDHSSVLDTNTLNNMGWEKYWISIQTRSTPSTLMSLANLFLKETALKRKKTDLVPSLPLTICDLGKESHSISLSFDCLIL